jgi:hypothetical protein
MSGLAPLNPCVCAFCYEDNRATPLNLTQVAVCGPGLKDWYWTKLSGFGKHLRTLPVETRNSIGYVPVSQKGKATIAPGNLERSKVYIKLLLLTINSSFSKDFSMVDDLLE